jgi:hypothetical protein
VPQNLKGLQDFARANAWKEVIELSNKLLNQKSDLDTEMIHNDELSLPYRLRLEGLFRLKMFDELAQESWKILQQTESCTSEFRSDIFFDPSSNVSIAMNLLLCEVKVMTGRASESLEHLQFLRMHLNALDYSCSPADRMSLKASLLRVECSLINTFIRQRNWRLAISELTVILNRVKDMINSFANKPNVTSIPMGLWNALILIKCLMSRILLQVIMISNTQPIRINFTHLFT